MKTMKSTFLAVVQWFLHVQNNDCCFMRRIYFTCYFPLVFLGIFNSFFSFSYKNEYWCYAAAPNWGNVISQDATRLRAMDCARIDFLASCSDMIRQCMEGYDWFNYNRNNAAAAVASGQAGLGR